MKIVPIIILIILLPTLSLAASERCAKYHNQALDLRDEGFPLYEEGEENYKAFYDLQEETIKTFSMNRIFKRPQQGDSTEKIIAAVKLLDLAIKKTKMAKPKFERSLHYADKAKKYCYDDDYESAEKIADAANTSISRINKKVSGEGNVWTLFMPDYSIAKYELLGSLTREGMTDAAIHLIKNEDINLNLPPEGGDLLLIEATERSHIKIVQTLVENDANIDGQDEKGYSALAIAATIGDYDLFTYLFNKKASVFQLNGFNSLTKYKACNLADMVYFSSYSDELKRNKEIGEHPQILEFLKTRGLTPVCNLNPLVAKVNGEPIHQNDIDFTFNTIALPKFQSQNQGQDIPADQKRHYEKDILKYLIKQQLQAQAAVKAGVEIDSEVMENLATRIHNREDNFKIDSIRRYVKNELLVQKVIQQEVIDKISIQDDELRKYYAMNPDKFTESEHIHASHILMSDKTKLEEVLSLAKKEGSDFAELAEKYSEEPSSAKGGDLGFFKRGQMAKPFDDSAFALNEGEISDIVKTQLGFHIIQLIERKAGGVIPFGNVKGRLHEWMKQKMMSGEIDKWTEALRAHASVEIL